MEDQNQRGDLKHNHRKKKKGPTNETTINRKEDIKSKWIVGYQKKRIEEQRRYGYKQQARTLRNWRGHKTTHSENIRHSMVYEARASEKKPGIHTVKKEFIKRLECEIIDNFLNFVIDHIFYIL